MISPLERGRAQGKLALTSFEKADLKELLVNEQQIARELEVLQREIKEKAWKLEYSDHIVRKSGEIEINDIEYQLMPWSIFKSNYSIMLDIGTVFPIVKEVRLHKLIYDIATDKMKYDKVSIDLVKKEVTHINEIFWNWEESWENDPEKLVEAFETLKVLKWLIEEKKYVLGNDYDEIKYRRIRELLEKSLEKHQSIQLSNITEEKQRIEAT